MIAGGRRYIYYASRKDKFRLWGLADLHLGNVGCVVKLIKQDVAEIAADPFSFWIGLGDYADYIGYQDRRFDPEAVSPDLQVRDMGRLGQALATQARDIFEPIKGKCLGLCYGNHEAKYMKHANQQWLHGWLCNEVGVPNLGYCCFLDLMFVRQARRQKPPELVVWPFARGHGGRNNAVSRARGEHTRKFRLFAHHGTGYAQTPGGKLNKLIQFMDYFASDLTMIAHIHDETAKRLVRLGANQTCTKLVDKEQVGTLCGTYLATYPEGTIATYSEQKGYRPTSLGAATIEIDPDKGKAKVLT